MTKLCAIHIEKVTNNNNYYYISVLHSCSDDNLLSWLNRHLELIGQAAFLQLFLIDISLIRMQSALPVPKMTVTYEGIASLWTILLRCCQLSW